MTEVRPAQVPLFPGRRPQPPAPCPAHQARSATSDLPKSGTPVGVKSLWRGSKGQEERPRRTLHSVGAVRSAEGEPTAGAGGAEGALSSLRARACAHTRARAHMCTRAPAHEHVHVHTPHLQMHPPPRAHAHTCAHTLPHTCTLSCTVHALTCTHVHTLIHMCVHMHAHTFSHLHTCLCAYSHTCMRTLPHISCSSGECGHSGEI